jgi:hypothetical protein
MFTLKSAEFFEVKEAITFCTSASILYSSPLPRLSSKLSSLLTMLLLVLPFLFLMNITHGDDISLGWLKPVAPAADHHEP